MDSSQSPKLVARTEIPLSVLPEDGDLEVRPFGAHEVLSSMVPSSTVGLAWTHARHGQDVALRSHPTAGLLIVLDGSAELVGATRGPVKHGDVITLPKNQAYGFTAIGPGGLHAIHVAFHEGDAADTGEVLSYEQLVARNEARAQAALRGPFFGLLRDGALDSDAKRAMIRECLRVFSNAFQTILLTRQATCRDDAFAEPFDSHLMEERGHNRLLDVAGDVRAFRDPLLAATSNWFCHQMLVLDNAGKAVLHVVLETAGDHFHNLAQHVFESDRSADYFKVHAENDEDHRDLGYRLLQGHHPETYRRLHQILEDGWDMFDALAKRIAYLVERAGSSS